MRTFFLLLLLLIVAFNAGAQIKKIFGYVQEVHAGTIQIDIPPTKELNTEEKISTGSRRYFIFAAINKNRFITIEQVWIEGNLYAFKVDTVSKFPYVLQSSNGGEKIFRDTLVKSSADLIIQLKNLVKTEHAAVPGIIKKAVSENKVVISYVCKKRLLFTALQNTTSITPVFAQ